MQTINDQIPAQNIANDYQEVLSWKVTGKPCGYCIEYYWDTSFCHLWDDLFQFSCQRGKMPRKALLV